MPAGIGYSALLPAPAGSILLISGAFLKVMAREDEHFDIDDEFLGEAEEAHEFDPLLERAERRPKAAAPGKRGKAAWSRVEDVLAERQLLKELRDIFEDD